MKPSNCHHFYEARINVLGKRGLAERRVEPDDVDLNSCSVMRDAKKRSLYYLRYLAQDGSSAAFKMHALCQREFDLTPEDYEVVACGQVYTQNHGSGSREEIFARLDLPRGANPDVSKPAKPVRPMNGEIFSPQELSRCGKR